MDIIESVCIALRGLTANKMRSGLTMLGIIIGVGTVTALLSIGQGAQAAITEQIRGIGSNLIFVVPGAVQHGGVRAALGSAATLTFEDAEAIADPASCPHVAAVAPVLSGNAQVVYGGSNINTSITGATPEFQYIRNSPVREGRFLEQHDLDTIARVAVLGSITAEELFEGADPIGQVLKVQRMPFRVIGVLEEKGGMGMEDDVVIIPITTAYRLLGGGAAPEGGRRVTAINVSAVDESRVDAAIEEITWLLRDRHKIRHQEDDFTVMSQKDILGAMNQVTTILTIFLGAIAAISLLVGGIGIMNIMLVSVTERTREIGIRKAVGAKRRDILMQFLIEAVVLSVVGGLAGILFGAGIAKLVTMTGQIVTVVSPRSVLMALGFSVAVGLFFGNYPARRAAVLNPIDALRYE